jgi:hypothetical protein
MGSKELIIISVMVAFVVTIINQGSILINSNSWTGQAIAKQGQLITTTTTTTTRQNAQHMLPISLLGPPIPFTIQSKA